VSWGPAGVAPAGPSRERVRQGVGDGARLVAGGWLGRVRGTGPDWLTGGWLGRVPGAVAAQRAPVVAYTYAEQSGGKRAVRKVVTGLY
jgi:hypothetical protein